MLMPRLDCLVTARLFCLFRHDLLLPRLGCLVTAAWLDNQATALTYRAVIKQDNQAVTGQRSRGINTQRRDYTKRPRRD